MARAFRLERLKREARDAATWRGHRLTPFRTWAWRDATTRPTRAHADCRDCGRGVTVDVAPAPNGIDIGGAAVAVNCERLACREGR